jgi:uncharacterized membrane protein YozB (DUF420 family)
MVIMMQIPAIDMAGISLAISIIALLFLIYGFLWGAKKNNEKLHHDSLAMALILGGTAAFIWMIPQAIRILDTGIDLGVYWYLTLMIIVGSITLAIAFLIPALYLLKGQKAELTKKLKLWMKIVLLLWFVSFVIGIVNFVMIYFVA